MSTDKFKIIKSIRQEFPFPDECPKVKENLHGWFGEGNKRLLLRYIRGTTKIVFEFGAWLGLSTKFILDATPSDCLVISIDHWEGGATIKNSEKYDELIESSYDTFIRNMWDYRDRLIPLRMDGNEAMHYLHDKGIIPDLIYLDMDHEYDPVKKDLGILTKYYPQTVIVGDDMKYHHGVDQAVNEMGKKLKNYILEVDVNSYALVPPNSVKQEYQLRYKYKDPQQPDPELKLLIVVPLTQYHKSEITRFKTTMGSYLKDIDHEIYFLRGNDKFAGSMNIGKLCNAAVKYAQNERYNTIIFNKLECIPDKDLVQYYKYKPKRPIIIGAATTNFKSYTYEFGVISFQLEDIMRINGYPNQYWGLSPDRDVINRMVLSDMKVWLPNRGSLQTKQEKKLDKKIESKLKQAVRQTWKRWRLDGLNNLDIVRIKREDNIDVFDVNGYEVLLFPTKEIHITLDTTEKVRVFKKELVTSPDPTADITGFRKELSQLKKTADKFTEKNLLELAFPYSNLNSPNHSHYMLSIIKHIPLFKIKKIALLSKILAPNLVMTEENMLYPFLNNIASVTYLDYPLPQKVEKYDFVISNHRFTTSQILNQKSRGFLIQEERSLHTRFEFLVFAFERLNKGGSYHNLHYLPTSLISYQLLTIINNHFDTVKIVKTPYGKYYGTVFHVIGIGFRGISKEQLNIYKSIQQDWYNYDPSKGMLLRHSKDDFDDNVVSVSKVLFTHKLINAEMNATLKESMRIFVEQYISNLLKKVNNMEQLQYVSQQNIKAINRIKTKLTELKDDLYKNLVDEYNQFLQDIGSS